MALRLRTPWRWWPAIRNFWLVVGVYVAGAVSVADSFMAVAHDRGVTIFPFTPGVVLVI